MQLSALGLQGDAADCCRVVAGAVVADDRVEPVLEQLLLDGQTVIDLLLAARQECTPKGT